MDEEPIMNDETHRSFLSQHRYLFLVGSTIVVSLILVTISLVIYNISGAAQLDLSRPGYQAIGKQVIDDEEDLKSYPSSGTVNSETISDFKKLYDKQADAAGTVDAFSGDPLSPDSLGYGTTAVTPSY